MTVSFLDYEGAEIAMLADSDMERGVRLRSCAKEPETVEWLKTLSPGVFIDIGSNVGAYSLVAAHLGHTVWAVEPHPATYEHLRKNVKLNGLDIVTLSDLLSDHDGETTIEWSSLDAGSALHQMGQGGQTWHCSTLDSLCERYLIKPDYLKVDTDGSEYEVLVGGRRILEGVRSLQVELDASIPNHDVRIGGLLGDLGFVQKSRTWHGDTAISNAVYER